MEFDLETAAALLARTPAALDALLRDLPDEWVLRNEGGDSWSAFDIVGHLIHADRTDWLVRARTILEYGEAREFPPFDRLGQRDASKGKDLGQLLDEFAAVRAESLRELKELGLSGMDFERRGLHPAFGTVKMSELLATWTAHDLNHLHQLARVMAHQYRGAVGPWSAYLGVMSCSGHSGS
ncbi:MAG TPA: DinB family protein [Bryobacteraceae bacterium]|nr:DinB family protein [Bryobacteraceae bacterium]